MKATEYAKLLVKHNGLPVAQRIAERCKRGSDLANEGSLPNPGKGDNIFFPSDRTGKGAKTAINVRKNTHGFWCEVAGILKKAK